MKKVVGLFIICGLLTLVGCKDLTQQDPPSTTPTSTGGQQDVAVHIKNVKNIMHGDNLYQPAGSCNYSGCHGVDLTGAVGPSCLQCHEALWDGSTGVPSTHSWSNLGVMHHPDRLTASTSCVGCHGAGLQGGSIAPSSCYKCHDALWTGAGGRPATHTKNKDGYLHAPELKTPIGYCDACHGADLTGGVNAPSCFKCHGNKWSGGGDD